MVMILNGFLFAIGVIVAMSLWSWWIERIERREAEQIAEIRRTTRLDGSRI